VGACVDEEMDEDIDVHAEMVGVGLCKGTGVVSGAGTSSNETLLLPPLSLDEVMGSKSCGSRVSAAEMRWIKQLAGRYGLFMEHRECLIEENIAGVSHTASGVD